MAHTTGKVRLPQATKDDVWESSCHGLESIVSLTLGKHLKFPAAALSGNKHADVENGLADEEREGEGGMFWESSIDVYTLPRVKQTAGGKPLYSTASWTQCSART